MGLWCKKICKAANSSIAKQKLCMLYKKYVLRAEIYTMILVFLGPFIMLFFVECERIPGAFYGSQVYCNPNSTNALAIIYIISLNFRIKAFLCYTKIKDLLQYLKT